MEIVVPKLEDKRGEVEIASCKEWFTFSCAFVDKDDEICEAYQDELMSECCIFDESVPAPAPTPGGEREVRLLECSVVHP